MLDITHLNHCLSEQSAGGTGQIGPQAATPAPGDNRRSPDVANLKPVVTWRVTRACNLNCVSCLSDSQPRGNGSELSTAEGLDLIRDLAAMRVPRLQFAGGDPLLRTDLVELVAYASKQGIQPSLLTNGTLLTRTLAVELKRAGLASVSILLEGIGRDVDRRRGVPGAFDAVMDGYTNGEAAGLAMEIRTPLDRWSYPELPDFLSFIESRRLRQVVFAHLVYAGRGRSPHDDLTHEQKRRALDLILERAEDFHRRGLAIRVATDENHADAIYYYLQLARRNPRSAASAYRLLAKGGGGAQGAGVGLAGIDSVGNVHPDAYWDPHVLGNVRETPFSEIWQKSSDPLLLGLRDRLPLLKGRCANCRWKAACGGNLRVRAQEFFGDPWMPDPACYLADNETSKDVFEQVEAMEDDVLLIEQAA